MKRTHQTPTTRLVVKCILHQIGAQAPYFSCTATLYEVQRDCWVNVASGCLHEEILATWPDLAPLVADTRQGIGGDQEPSARVDLMNYAKRTV